MATFVQTNVGLYLNGYSLASTFNAVSINLSNSPQDATVYGDTTVSNKAGLSSTSLEGEGYWDSTTDGVLQERLSLGSGATTISVSPVDQAVGSPILFNEYTNATYNPFATGTVGSMLGFSVSAESRGEKNVSGQILISPSSAITTSGNSLVNSALGAVSATQSVYGVMHVLAASGSLVAQIRSSPTSGFGSSTQRILFTTSTAIGAEMKSLAGAVTDAHWRVDYTVSGGGSFTFIVGVGII